MNWDGQLDVVDLTTLDRVRGLIPQSAYDSTMDELIARLIVDQSAMITRHLGLHTLSATRSEVYELRQHARVLSLDAKPIVVTQIKESSSIPDDWTTVASVGTSQYVVNAAAGWIRFLKPRPNSPGYIRVNYSGGFGVTTANVITDFPDIAQACELAVKYELERLATIGGDITTIPGAGTSFGGSYKMHIEVERLLSYHRRAYV